MAESNSSPPPPWRACPCEFHSIRLSITECPTSDKQDPARVLDFVVRSPASSGVSSMPKHSKSSNHRCWCRVDQPPGLHLPSSLVIVEEKFREAMSPAFSSFFPHLGTLSTPRNSSASQLPQWPATMHGTLR